LWNILESKINTDRYNFCICTVGPCETTGHWLIQQMCSKERRMVNDNNIRSDNIIKVKPPAKTEIRTMRFLICCGLTSMTLFIVWFSNADHIGYLPIYLLLTFALIFKLVKMVQEWYHYWSVKVPEAPLRKREYSVDILTTFCPGEPHEMIIRTLLAMKAVKYPHTNYLCDEGNDPELKKLCEREGIIHVTRVEKDNAKAGNINNALKIATGEICVILDPDHEIIPEFLDRVLPYFENDEIGYVQSVQGYHNQSESIIARGAAEQTYHFYGPMMMCMNTYGTVQAIGANCAFRRKALDSIGGHAPGLAEDMHTAMQLQAKGWKSVYVPEILTRGLVPATLSAYYKQQLKWSRGTFELLFRTYPRLFKKFTWRQKIHYLTVPLYFFYGVINFIDILVPVLALGLAEVPWEVNLKHFAAFFFPLLGISLLIRFYAQRWLLEKHERGFHVVGGMLRASTWWIFLVGFIYTILKVRVPYIPTPKEDEHRNYWKLSLPNVIASLCCFNIIIYGLSIDWTPYSFAMALYSLTSLIMLGYIVIISQQKLVSGLDKTIKKIPGMNFCIFKIKELALKFQYIFYALFKNGPVVSVIALSLIYLSFNTAYNKDQNPTIPAQKEFGGFYTGINLAENDSLLQGVLYNEKSIDKKINVISFEQKWSTANNKFPWKLMREIKKQNSVPLINWVPQFDSAFDNNQVCLHISKGKYDSYLIEWAEGLIRYKEPVYISFATGFDDEEKSWSASGNNSPEDFKIAWQYIHTFFGNMGVSNLTWVWSPKNSTAAEYYPGSRFVDWIGISCLNYGNNKNDNDWYWFPSIYEPYRKSLGGFEKPAIITEFGSLSGTDQEVWINNGLKEIKEKYHEIRSVVFFNNKKHLLKLDTSNKEYIYQADFSFSSAHVVNALAKYLDEEPFSKEPFLKNESNNSTLKAGVSRSSNIKGSPGSYQLNVNGRPYYVRGVAYNPAHDWRDGNMPLTRKQLENDFEKIKAMGANTIRRYNNGIFDKNILNIAEEFDLKVLFGFWFDPKIDYYKDTVRVNEYIKLVENKVKEYKDYPSVLGWSLGNETWGILKHKFSKPYLTKVRNQYVKFIEQLAGRVHKIDPTRPIFCSMEHEEYQIAGELVAFRDGAPSIDVIGINSYYREQISELNHITWEFDSLRPYLISEFGPRGYWDPLHNKTIDGLAKEETDEEKAKWYKEQWINYVAGYKGYNIGGVAYCWHDRMEGSYTWFGLSDYKARIKPSYYGLKEIWTNNKNRILSQFSIEAPLHVVPGKEYKFIAVSDEIRTDDLEFEWCLLKDEFLDKVGSFEYSKDKRTIRLKIPTEPSNYRLYLFVSDTKGNVTTASVPIRIK